MTIRNPVEWVADQFGNTAHGLDAAGRSLSATEEDRGLAPPAVRRITVADVREALRAGIRDFAAYRTDVLFIGVVYPIAGLILARLMAGYDMLPLVFPLVSGFALLGPAAAAGLYEMSRRRERGRMPAGPMPFAYSAPPPSPGSRSWAACWPRSSACGSSPPWRSTGRRSARRCRKPSVPL